MQSLFGNAVQDYYLDLARKNYRERKARLEKLRTQEDALRYISEVKNKIVKLFPLPQGKTPLNACETGMVDFGSFILHKIIYHSRPDFPVTGNLYLPKTSKKVPAVLFLCGHAQEGKAYHKYQIFPRAIAMKGYAAFAIDPICQGERLQYLDFPNYQFANNMCDRHNIWGRQLLLSGDSFGAWRAWDAIRGLDYLLSRPEVDSTRVGVTGCSGGGTMTTFVNALEDRLTMAAPSCYVTSWLHNVENELPADIEQMPLGTLEAGLEMGDFYIARAPRPVVLLGGDNDFFDPRGTRETYEEIRQIYKLLGAEEAVRLTIGNNGHDFPRVHREAIYSLFNEVAKVASDSVEPDKVVISSEEELYCAPEGQVKNLPGNKYIHQFAAERASELAAARKTHTKEELCGILRGMLKLEPPFIPHYRVLRVRCGSGKVIYSRFGLETEPDGRLMCVLKLKKEDYFYHIERSSKMILYIPNLDSQDELSSMIFPDDVTVYGLDIRGIGECTPSGCDQNTERDFFAEYEFDYHYASLGLMFGKPYLSGKVKDILCAVELLTQGGFSIEVHARGQGTIPATIAALLSDKITKLKLINGPDSWESIVRTPVPPYPLSVLIPGVISQTDLPEIRAAIADKLR